MIPAQLLWRNIPNTHCSISCFFPLRDAHLGLPHSLPCSLEWCRFDKLLTPPRVRPWSKRLAESRTTHCLPLSLRVTISTALRLTRRLGLPHRLSQRGPLCGRLAMFDVPLEHCSKRNKFRGT